MSRPPSLYVRVSCGGVRRGIRNWFWDRFTADGRHYWESRPRRLTLADLHASLLRNAAEFRSRGINCCAQLAENTAARLTEAMEDKE